MADLRAEKQIVRRAIAEQKKSFSAEQLKSMSFDVILRIEEMTLFRRAKTVLTYHSLSDEVDTHELIGKYVKEKQFLLPIVSGDNLLINTFEDNRALIQSDYGIMEPPKSLLFTDYDSIDIVLVPGLAFDVNRHRLGRGKGYYDRLLPNIKAPKVGICFDFQLLEFIPANELDMEMDFVVSQSRIY